MQTLGWMVLTGLFRIIAQMTLRQVLKETNPTALIPFDFLKLIWTASIGAWFFAEIPDIFRWIGAAFIFSAGLFIAYRERRAKHAILPPRGGRRTNCRQPPPLQTGA